jgi:Zn finger protein HypA/HybF involved in hydrogenase expression
MTQRPDTPPGTPGPKRGHKTVHCENGHKWTVPGLFEAGGFFADSSEDYQCPQCGSEALES